METIRSEVASSWRIVADSNEWQRLFQHLLADFLVANQPTSGAADQIMSKKPDMTNNVNKGVLGSPKQPNTKIDAVVPAQNKNSNPVKKEDGNRTMTPQTKKQSQIKFYLARIGLTYDIFQKQHRKHSSLNKAYFCKSGGFVKLQESLQNHILTKCSVCQDLLKVKGFSFDELEQQEHAPLMEPTNSSLVKREHIESKVESSAKKQKLDVLQVVKQDKDFLILERGTKGKRFPVQCLICSRSTHAKSKTVIFDLVRQSSIWYFHQHLNGASHLHAKTKKEIKDENSLLQVKRELSQCLCKGYIVAPSSQGIVGKLHDSFSTYAAYTHLADSKQTQHEYSYDLNGNIYTIRHKSCKKTFPCPVEAPETICWCLNIVWCCMDDCGCMWMCAK